MSPLNRLVAFACAASVFCICTAPGQNVIGPKALFRSTAVAQASELIRVGETSGVVVEMPVAVGQAVSKGQLLARLNSDQQRFELDMAAMAKEARGGISVAEAERSQQQAQYTDAAERYRKRQLGDSGMAFAKASLDRTEGLVTGQQEGLKAAERVYEFRKNEYDKRFILAPFEGMVTEVKTEVGQGVNVAQHVFTVQNPNALLVTFQLPKAIAEKLASNTYAEIHDSGSRVWAQVLDTSKVSEETTAVRMLLPRSKAADSLKSKTVFDINVGDLLEEKAW